MADTVEKTNLKPQITPEKWAKSWFNMNTFLTLLMRNHPIAGALVHGIYNKLTHKENTEKKPLTDEAKYKTAFENLASVQDPKVRAAIHNMSQQLQQKYSQKPTTPRLDLQARMQAVVKNLREVSGVGDLLTTTPVKPVQFGHSMAASPLAHATADKPTSPRPEVTTGQARKKKVSPV